MTRRFITGLDAEGRCRFICVNTPAYPVGNGRTA